VITKEEAGRAQVAAAAVSFHLSSFAPISSLGIRRILTHRFPYGVYFSVEGETIVIVAVLSTARDPAEWQRRV
jgi:plasmid stabilization system protein ParE